jgi:hypothetical protein
MKKVALGIALFLCAAAQAQISTVSNDKPLAFLNPALQNSTMDKGIVSLSYIVNPLVKEATPGAFLAIGEFKVSDAFRIGFNASQVENRLSKSSSYMGYLSYRLELEKENYLIFGADIGSYTDVAKLGEFNKVWAPNKFVYAPDSSLSGKKTGLDYGIGVSYSYNGFTAGLAFSKLNKPAVYPFPLRYYEKYYFTVGGGGVDSGYKLQDTTIALSEGTFGVESNVNLMYQWNASAKVKVTHSAHFGNIDLGGFDYAGLQNIVEINKKHSIGLGAFYNGDYGFIASAGVGFSEKIKLSATAFFQKDLNYDVATKKYVDDGFKPAIEANLRFQF